MNLSFKAGDSPLRLITSHLRCQEDKRKVIGEGAEVYTSAVNGLEHKLYRHRQVSN